MEISPWVVKTVYVVQRGDPIREKRGLGWDRMGYNPYPSTRAVVARCSFSVRKEKDTCVSPIHHLGSKCGHRYVLVSVVTLKGFRSE